MSDIAKLSALASELAVLKALADVVGDRLKDTRTDMQAALDAAGGVRQVCAKLPDGTEVAKVSLTVPKDQATVIDADAFLAWVREHAETEIVRSVVVTTEVRPAYRAALLAQMTKAGKPEVVDPQTGVIHTVPGIQVAASGVNGHSLRFAKTGKDAIAEAWRAGTISQLPLTAATSNPVDGDDDDADTADGEQ